MKNDPEEEETPRNAERTCSFLRCSAAGGQFSKGVEIDRELELYTTKGQIQISGSCCPSCLSLHQAENEDPRGRAKGMVLGRLLLRTLVLGPKGPVRDQRGLWCQACLADIAENTPVVSGFWGEAPGSPG